MPKVPTYDNQQVRAAGLPGVRQSIQTSADDFGAAQGRALQQTGQELGQVGSLISQRALQRQEEDNKTAVWEAYSKLSDRVRDYTYNPDTGVLNSRGSAAIGIAGRAAKDIGGFAEEIAKSLPNEEQRAQFKMMYQRRLDSDLDGLARHETEQRRQYRDQVATGVVKTASQDAAMRWNDPKYIDDSANMAVTALEGNLRSKGTAQELITAQSKEMRSGVWKAAMERAIQADPLRAKQMLDENRAKLTGDDAMDLDKMIKQPLQAARASAIVGQVVGGSSLPSSVATKIAQRAAAEGVDVNTALAIAKVENAKGDPNAKNPESSATGIFQMVDGTWKEAGGTDADRGDVDKQVELGIKHIKKNTEALRAALGRQPTGAEVYLSHQQGLAGSKALLTAQAGTTAVAALTPAYKGDVAKATAAIVKNGGTPDMKASDFVTMWGNGYGRKAGGTMNDAPLSEKLAAAKALAGDDVELQQAATAQVVQQHNLAQAAKRDEQDAAMEQIYEHVLKTGSYVGASAAALSKLDNKTLLELQTKAADTKTDWAFYDQFMALTPAEKAQVPLQLLMTRLSPSDMRVAVKERAEGKNGTSKAPWLQERSTVLRGYAKEAGILPSGDKVTPEESSKYNALSEYMNRKMDAYRQAKGVEMPESEFRQEAARAVTKVVTDLGVFSDTKKGVFELNGEPIKSIKKVEDVPLSIRSQLEGEIRARGKTVTDAVVLQLARAFIENDRKAALAILEGAK